MHNKFLWLVVLLGFLYLFSSMPVVAQECLDGECGGSEEDFLFTSFCSLMYEGYPSLEVWAYTDIVYSQSFGVNHPVSWETVILFSPYEIVAPPGYFYTSDVDIYLLEDYIMFPFVIGVYAHTGPEGTLGLDPVVELTSGTQLTVYDCVTMPRAEATSEMFGDYFNDIQDLLLPPEEPPVVPLDVL